MKGMTSHDGKMHGNVQTVGRYDESHDKKHSAVDEAKHPQEGDHGEIKTVVDEHGPAHKHIITKTAHGHHSETHHADGYVHHADHADLAEAHEHGQVAMEDAEHNPMGEDAMENAGEREGAEHPMGQRTPEFMA